MAEITADILERRPGPAPSATSDMPAIEPEPPANAPPAPTAPATVETPPAEGEAGTSGEEGEAREAGEGAAPVTTETAPPKPKTGIQERFSTLTEARKAAEARADAAEAREARLAKIAEEALARLPQATPPAPEPPAPPAPPEPRPVRENFDTPDAYDEALIEWSTRRAVQTARVENEVAAKTTKEAEDRVAAEQAQTEQFRAVQTTYAERREAAIEKHSDYAAVTEVDDGSLQISFPVAMAIMQHEDGPEVAYYLGKHPELSQKIAAMVVPGQVFPAALPNGQPHPLAGKPVPDAQRQLIELGKVFAAIGVEPAVTPAVPIVPAARQIPEPPPPVTPLRRGGGPAVTRTLEEIGNEGTMDDYAAERMARLREERSLHRAGKLN